MRRGKLARHGTWSPLCSLPTASPHLQSITSRDAEELPRPCPGPAAIGQLYHASLILAGLRYLPLLSLRHPAGNLSLIGYSGERGRVFLSRRNVDMEDSALSFWQVPGSSGAGLRAAPAALANPSLGCGTGLGRGGGVGGGRRCVSNASEGVARREGLSATSARPTARRSAGRACAGFPFIRV